MASVQGPRPTPAYLSAEVEALSNRLEDARARKQNLFRVGAATDQVEREIVDLRRQLREGGWLRAGDFLNDGRYLLLREVGRGGFAVVWEAHDYDRQQRVAIKVLHSNLAGDPLRRERFFRGARVMMELKSPAVVLVLEPKGEDGGFYYFVMELMSGGNLREAILYKRLKESAWPTIVLPIGEALALAHSKGVIHRDIKPSNILLDESNQPKLTDFDLVGVNDTTGGTRTGALGTVVYAAPECLDRPQDATARADVYGLGMTTIFCLHGKELSLSTFRDPEPTIANLDCPPQVQDILRRAVAWESNIRFSDVGVMIAALNDALRGQAETTAQLHTSTDIPLLRTPSNSQPSLSPQDDLSTKSRLGVTACITPQALPSVRRRGLRGMTVALGAALALAFVAGLTAYWPPSTMSNNISSMSPASLALSTQDKAGAADGAIVASTCPPDMVEVSAGTLRLESPDDVADNNKHSPDQIAISTYCIDRTEVTAKRYAQCVDAKTCTPAEEPAPTGWHRFCNGTRIDRQDHPANCIDWTQARTYCAWRGRRLPSNAEWEYAARGSDGRIFPWGNESPTANRLNACGTECALMLKNDRELARTRVPIYAESDGWQTTARVGSFPAGASPFGALDMAGNVWEWTADPHTEHPAANTTSGAVSQTSIQQTIRGGAWSSTDIALVRAAFRFEFSPSGRIFSIGFRCARGI